MTKGKIPEKQANQSIYPEQLFWSRYKTKYLHKGISQK